MSGKCFEIEWSSILKYTVEVEKDGDQQVTTGVYNLTKFVVNIQDRSSEGLIVKKERIFLFLLLEDFVVFIEGSDSLLTRFLILM